MGRAIRLLGTTRLAPHPAVPPVAAGGAAVEAEEAGPVVGAPAVELGSLVVVEDPEARPVPAVAARAGDPAGAAVLLVGADPEARLAWEQGAEVPARGAEALAADLAVGDQVVVAAHRVEASVGVAVLREAAVPEDLLAAAQAVTVVEEDLVDLGAVDRAVGDPAAAPAVPQVVDRREVPTASWSGKRSFLVCLTVLPVTRLLFPCVIGAG